MTLQVNAEDLHEDALERWFATYLLEGLLQKGIAYWGPNAILTGTKLLTSAERKLIQEAQSKGLTQGIPDMHMDAAIKHTAASLGIELDEKKFYEHLQIKP